jgi:hypothetical protein
VVATFSRTLNQVAGNRRHTVTAVTFDTSYLTGGESVTANDLGLYKLDYVTVLTTVGYVGEYITSTSTLLARWSGATTDAVLAQVSSTTNMGTVVFNVDAWGI